MTKHKITITIEDVDLNTNNVGIAVSFDPPLQKEIKMTGALTFAQKVMGQIRALQKLEGKPNGG